MSVKNPYADLLKSIGPQTPTSSIGDQFVKDLERTISLNRESRAPSATIKPSGIGGCLRMQVFTLNQEPQDVKMDQAGGIGITDIGSFRHEVLQQACINCASGEIKWIEPEIILAQAQAQGINTIIKERKGHELKCYNSDYNVSFQCDGIIEYQDKVYILEIKTEEYNKHNGRLKAEPAHEMQATLYAMCLGVTSVMFLYEDRNICHKKAYTYDVSPEIRHAMITRIRLITAYAQARKLPPKEKKCLYCGYKTVCKIAGETNPIELSDLLLIIEDQKRKISESGVTNAGTTGPSQEEQPEEDRK